MTTSNRPRIVVGVDGSPSSKHALRWAKAQAERFEARIEAVIVWTTPAAYAWSGGYWAAPGEPDPAGSAEKVLSDTIDEVFAEHRPADLELAVTPGNAAHELIERSRGALMLVVGSRGHGGFAGLLLGSVSQACAEHAACPVLVVHGDTAPREAAPAA